MGLEFGGQGFGFDDLAGELRVWKLKNIRVPSSNHRTLNGALRRVSEVYFPFEGTLITRWTLSGLCTYVCLYLGMSACKHVCACNLCLCVYAYAFVIVCIRIFVLPVHVLICMHNPKPVIQKS